jgi:hypothetical protein
MLWRAGGIMESVKNLVGDIFLWAGYGREEKDAKSFHDEHKAMEAALAPEAALKVGKGGLTEFMIFIPNKEPADIKDAIMNRTLFPELADGFYLTDIRALSAQDEKIGKSIRMRPVISGDLHHGKTNQKMRIAFKKLTRVNAETARCPQGRDKHFAEEIGSRRVLEGSENIWNTMTMVELTSIPEDKAVRDDVCQLRKSFRDYYGRRVCVIGKARRGKDIYLEAG